MAEPNSAPPRPCDAADGIPDRAARRPAWKYILLATLFAAWIAVLVGLFVWGR
jgi:hypothetical protein